MYNIKLLKLNTNELSFGFQNVYRNNSIYYINITSMLI